MPRDHRRAYHEAGHAALAARHEIAIQRVALNRLPGRMSSSTFQSALDYCPLHVGRVIDESRLDKYISFLLAGSATEMLAMEYYHEFTGRDATQDRFRQRWYQLAWARPELHLDLAYYYMIVWGSAPLNHIGRWKLSCWRTALSMVCHRQVWQAIEQVAQRLIAGEVLQQEDITAALL